MEPQEAFSLGPVAVSIAVTLETQTEAFHNFFCLLGFLSLPSYLHSPSVAQADLARRHIPIDCKICLA